VSAALFGYGTFRDPRWRRGILGAEYPARAATVRGWSAVALPSGYLSAIAHPDAMLAGVLIDLDEVGWQIADAWEEVPRYRRTPVVAETGDAVVPATMYVVPGVAGTTVAAETCATLDEAAVTRAIGAFAATMRAIRAGYRTDEP
jgi:hypothetical protein